MSRYAVNKLVHEIQFPQKRERYRGDGAGFLAGVNIPVCGGKMML